MELKENMVVADKFKLVRMIGRGGMGSVWEAQHVALDTPCAVKFIEGELANVAEAHARFEREAKAAAQLRSQHVVQIFDHGVWQGKPYIAMELLNGEDLGRRLAKTPGGRLPLPKIHEIVQQVCKALTKAHQAGIVHRDLKPDNIFLCNEDDGSDKDLVKILDFGVAKATGQAIDGSNTKTGAMLGTPYYMSPEQAQGIKSVDARSDLWSLAVIVFQCVTGRLPFESEALGDLLVKIIVNPVPMMSHYAPDVPPELDAWWRIASERAVEKRFQTAKQFAEELNKAIVSVGGITQMTPATSVKIPQGTAVMQHGTPPGLQGQQFGQMMQTPPGAQPSPFGQTPQPFMNTPHPSQPGAYPGTHAITGSGLSGDSTGIPKKGPPMVLIGAFAAFAIVGIAAGGVAWKMRSSPATPPVASAPPPEVTATPPATAPPEPPPAETAKTPDPPADETSKPPETPPTTTAAAKPPVVAGKTTSQPKQPPPPPPSTTATPKKKPPSTPSTDPLGF